MCVSTRGSLCACAQSRCVAAGFRRKSSRLEERVCRGSAVTLHWLVVKKPSMHLNDQPQNASKKVNFYAD